MDVCSFGIFGFISKKRQQLATNLSAEHYTLDFQ